MTNARSWVEALNISPENLTKWSSEAPDGKPLLVYCLEQGHIEAEPYFAWAKEFFQIPVLDSAFFPRIDAQMVQHAKSEGSWHPWRFPIDKWDDVTIVACVEPVTDQDHPHISFVLADPRAMSAAWGPNATHAPSTESEASISFSPPEASVASFSIPEPEMPAASESDASENTPVEEVASVTEEPIGFSTETKPFVLNLEGDLFGPNTHVTSPTAQPIAEPASPPPPAMEDDSLLLSIANFSPEGEKMEMPSIPVIDAEAEEPVQAPVPPPPASKPALKVVPKPVEEEPVVAAAKPGEENSVIDKAFGDVLEKYNYCLLMKVSDQKAKLFKADPNLKVTNAAHTTVELSYPTFLRIVSKTGMPYHGYLVDSPAHRDFFNAFGISELPGCVTAVPVKKDNKVFGMLIGIGTSELLKNDNLAIVSTAAARSASTIINLWSKAS